MKCERQGMRKIGNVEDMKFGRYEMWKYKMWKR